MKDVVELLSAPVLAVERQNLLDYLAMLCGQLERRALRVHSIQVGPNALKLFARALPEALSPLEGTNIIGEWWGAHIYLDLSFEGIAVHSEPEFLSKVEMTFNQKG